ncbi:PREDICTED: serine--tRNA synthetase-like protein Slimp [Rhagoletis zephyria]|uniref:serine--tRNA synthetase-like protein Slimp n=1 Tax=Rhagoletis zephyria TaxID=28612 RepID=UPI00081191AB|nr:PREDICTED: serine--tRNA synthetase-like protein Slimp [Rhagoletis zephyria]
MVHLPTFTARHLLTTAKYYTFRRSISALYITGDKAKKNYAPLQPYMDFEGTLNSLASLEDSIKARGLQINLNEIKAKYEKYNSLQSQIKQVEAERDSVSNKLREITKAGAARKDEIEKLKQSGVELRNHLKTLKTQSYPIEEDFVHSFLSLPNTLHPECPQNNFAKLLYRSPTARCEEQQPTHLAKKDLIRFIKNDRYYLLGTPAEFDVYSMQALTNYFVEKGGFMQMSNPDFVRLVLLEASATPLEHYHLVQEEDKPSEINRAFLTGGATFEGFLGAFARLVVYPTSLPLPCVAAGRSYEIVPNTSGLPDSLFTATQSNAVQTFVATRTAEEAYEQMEKILNLAVDFYKELRIHFRITYADASTLTNAECLRANIEMYSPAEQRYICVGRVSNYSDYVSKRIMFCIRGKNNYIFPHLVGGPVLYTTRLIALLIENGLKLEDCKLLGDREVRDEEGATGLNEFKDLFK